MSFSNHIAQSPSHSRLIQTLRNDAKARQVSLACDGCGKKYDHKIIGQPCTCGCWNLSEVENASA